MGNSLDKAKSKYEASREVDDVTMSGEILNRLDSLEASSLVFDATLAPLTPSDDLEAVKAILNQIIGVINKD